MDCADSEQAPRQVRARWGPRVGIVPGIDRIMAIRRRGEDPVLVRVMRESALAPVTRSSQKVDDRSRP